MIVFTRVFLILLVPLHLYGAPAPSSGHRNTQSIPSLHSVVESIGLDPLPSQPWHPNPGQPRRFADLTSHFIDPQLTDSDCKAPLNSWYRESSSPKHIFFLPGLTHITSNVIAATPNGELMLLRPGSKVFVSRALNPDDKIHVPADKSVPVVNVPPEEQESIWKGCGDLYNKTCKQFLGHEGNSEAEATWMCECFHNNIFHIRSDFIRSCASS